MRRIEAGYEPCEVAEATHIQLHFPGPFATRILPVITHGKREGTPNWSWNGDTEKPTIRPSILTRGGSPVDDKEHVCHCWVNDGIVQFLDDSTHEFSGQSLELLDVE